MRLDEYRGKPRRPDPDAEGEAIDTPRFKPTVPVLSWLIRPDVGRELDDPRYRRWLAAKAATLESADLPECCD
jgi:hypothetical protein